jgi:hypothetical protein
LFLARLSPAVESSAADWVVAGLETFAESVLSLVPKGFPAYVRVFHPAYRFDPSAVEKRTPICWAEIAAANGTQGHAGMQLSGLTGYYRYEGKGQEGVYDYPPTVGSLPVEVASELVAVLVRHTTTPEHCWFAVWNGFGSTRADVRRAPTFELPKREYHLLTGPIDAITENVLDPGGQSANIWWPDDRAWFVATEIDLRTTYIGCSQACSDAIDAVPELEALPIDPATGVTFNSDLVNPQPQMGP